MTSQSWVYRSNQSTYDVQLESRSVPSESEIPADSVLVRVRAVSLNYRDVIAWRNLAGRQVDGRVPASDGAGEIVAVGKNVRDWMVGDRVAGCFFQKWQSEPFEMSYHKTDLGGSVDGMLQEHICLPSTGIVRIPSYMDFAQASTLPCAALTAWYALVARGSLQKEQTVLCIGTGGVSVFALQIATALGARVIITSSDHQKEERAMQLGAWKTVNYVDTPNWSEEIIRITNGRGVDHVVEVGGPGTLEQSMKAVAPSGHIALIGVLTGFGAPTTSLFPLLAKNVRVNGIYVGPRDEFVRMNDFLESNKLQPVIDNVFCMKDAPLAFEYLHSGKHFGKVVISL